MTGPAHTTPWAAGHPPTVNALPGDHNRLPLPPMANDQSPFTGISPGPPMSVAALSTTPLSCHPPHAKIVKVAPAWFSEYHVCFAVYSKDVVSVESWLQRYFQQAPQYVFDSLVEQYGSKLELILGPTARIVVIVDQCNPGTGVMQVYSNPTSYHLAPTERKHFVSLRMSLTDASDDCYLNASDSLFTLLFQSPTRLQVRIVAVEPAESNTPTMAQDRAAPLLVLRSAKRKRHDQGRNPADPTVTAALRTTTTTATVATAAGMTHLATQRAAMLDMDTEPPRKRQALRLTPSRIRRLSESQNQVEVENTSEFRHHEHLRQQQQALTAASPTTASARNIETSSEALRKDIKFHDPNTSIVIGLQNHNNMMEELGECDRQGQYADAFDDQCASSFDDHENHTSRDDKVDENNVMFTDNLSNEESINVDRGDAMEHSRQSTAQQPHTNTISLVDENRNNAGVLAPSDKISQLEVDVHERKNPTTSTDETMERVNGVQPEISAEENVSLPLHDDSVDINDSVVLDTLVLDVNVEREDALDQDLVGTGEYDAENSQIQSQRERGESDNPIRETNSQAVTDDNETFFPLKLYHILADTKLKTGIDWLPHGRSWRITDRRLLERAILRNGSLYDIRNSTQFLKEAKHWGFLPVKTGKDRHSYYHERFIRDRPDLCTQMTRLSSDCLDQLGEVPAPNFEAFGQKNDKYDRVGQSHIPASSKKDAPIVSRDIPTEPSTSNTVSQHGGDRRMSDDAVTVRQSDIPRDNPDVDTNDEPSISQKQGESKSVVAEVKDDRTQKGWSSVSRRDRTDADDSFRSLSRALYFERPDHESGSDPCNADNTVGKNDADVKDPADDSGSSGPSSSSSSSSSMSSSSSGNSSTSSSSKSSSSSSHDDKSEEQVKESVSHDHEPRPLERSPENSHPDTSKPTIVSKTSASPNIESSSSQSTGKTKENSSPRKRPSAIIESLDRLSRRMSSGSRKPLLNRGKKIVVDIRSPPTTKKKRR